MKGKLTTKVLTVTEKASLRKGRVSAGQLQQMSVAMIAEILNCEVARAKEIHALAVFTSIPSIGIKFAEDLISIGYFSLGALADKTGPELIHELELKTGVWQDPCVEDQCRLVADVARNGNTGRQWWHFTAERKVYRAQHGYPPDRPTKAWYELLGYPAR